MRARRRIPRHAPALQPGNMMQISPMRINRKKLAKVMALAILGFFAVAGAYLVLLCHPGLFFSHTFTHGGITLYSDEPIPALPAGRILAEVERRLAVSPLAALPRKENHRIFICNRRWRFVLFANTRYNVGGLSYAPLSDNVFLRGVHFDANRLIGPSGKDVSGVRTLSYYIAHEITHNLIARELGFVKYWQLPAWKNEGYADLVAKGGDFDFEHARDQLRRNEKDLDPAHSGLYLRFHLLVAYLLDHKGTSIADLLKSDFDQTQLEAEILAPQAALEQSATSPGS